MADAKGVVGGLAALGKAGNAALHAQPGHAGAPPGEHLVGVALVAHVPDQAVFRGVEQVVQGDGEFHRAQVGGQVAAGAGHGFHQEIPQFLGQQGQLAPLQAAQVGGGLDVVQQGIGGVVIRIVDGR